MKKTLKITDFLLDSLKLSLNRFTKAKFGFMFLINIFKLPNFLTDKRVSIISKAKVISSLFVGVLYLLIGIDFLPELITGIFGLFDDTLVLVWSLGIMSEEIEKYKKLPKENIYKNMKKNKKNPNIIENINFKIKD